MTIPNVHGYAWVRIWTLHSAGPSSPFWREFWFEEKALESVRKAEAFFKREYELGVNDELSTGTEHWRGISYEVIPPPFEVLSQMMERRLEEWRSAEKALSRVEEARKLTKVVQYLAEKPRKRCVRWPSCGCERQGRHAHCYEPIEDRVAAAKAKARKKTVKKPSRSKP